MVESTSILSISTLTYLPFGFITSDRVAKICDKLQSSARTMQCFKLLKLGTATLNLRPMHVCDNTVVYAVCFLSLVTAASVIIS